MKVGSRVAGFAAVLAALCFGGPALGASRSPMPVPRQIVDTTEKDVRRRLRRPRVEILRRALTWRGIGLFSRGPRFPKASPAQPTNLLTRTADKQLYVQYTDGSFRRVPRGPQTRTEKKAAKRARRALMDRLAARPIRLSYPTSPHQKP